MTSRWPILALALASTLIAGCFDSHAGGGAVRAEDGGGIIVPPPPPPIDGGTSCDTYDGLVAELRCVPPSPSSGVPTIELVTHPSECCATGSVSARPSWSSEWTFDIDVVWTACDCCFGCGCIGPMEETRVELPVLPPGTYTVRAGGQACELVVPEVITDCRGADADLLMPEHVLEGQAIPITLTEEDVLSCGCAPGVALAGVDGRFALGLELCECCEECECVDPGYQASRILEPPPLGQYSFVRAGGSEASLVVHPAAACRVIEPLSVEVEAPRDDLYTSGPRLHWLRVRGEEWVCCAPTAGVLEPLPAGEHDLAFALRSCVEIDCDCEPAGPTPLEARFALADLAPGRYVIQIGASVTTFTVP